MDVINKVNEHLQKRNCSEWITNVQNTGSVTITKWDLTNNIVSCIFEFKAGSIDYSTDPFTVTDGRFDIKF